MTKRDTNTKTEHLISRRAVLQCGAALTAAALTGCGTAPAAGSDAASASFAAQPQPESTAAAQQPPAAKAQYRAMWFSYLDWARVDFSTEAAFRDSAGQVLDNCAALGLNAFIAQVRPFGDALYASTLFPWSHLCTGTQGQAPAFDPLDVLVELAHARGLSLEAWINPYRIRLNAKTPATLAENSLAYTHPEWCVTLDDGIYLNPAIAEAADYVVQGITELLDHYAVDGIHFDDYFYPSTDAAVDAVQYAAAGGTGADLAEWRRANVTRLVQNAHDAVKASDPVLRFGISPQGNPDNNYNGQYSDVSAWMTESLVDYICPQVYWGYHYTLKSGVTRFAYENITAEWLGMARSPAVALYFGLGAYRVGGGDGGANDDSTTQWQTGHNLADMVTDLTANGADGYALYRYDSLYNNTEYAALAEQEREALTAENAAQ